MSQIIVEKTDTFGGEANYCWVVRERDTVPDNATNRQIVQRAKKLIGWAGLRCDTTCHGDLFEIRPVGLCQIAFVTFGSNEETEEG